MTERVEILVQGNLVISFGTERFSYLPVTLYCMLDFQSHTFPQKYFTSIRTESDTLDTVTSHWHWLSDTRPGSGTQNQSNGVSLSTEQNYFQIRRLFALWCMWMFIVHKMAIFCSVIWCVVIDHWTPKPTDGNAASGFDSRLPTDTR
jgi:hypothetical protein